MFHQRSNLLKTIWVSRMIDPERVYQIRAIRHWFYYRIFDLLVSDFDRVHRQVSFPSVRINERYMSLCRNASKWCPLLSICVCVRARVYVQWLPVLMIFFFIGWWNCTSADRQNLIRARMNILDSLFHLSANRRENEECRDYESIENIFFLEGYLVFFLFHGAERN